MSSATCRACGSDDIEVIVSLTGKAITSLAVTINAPTRVHHCQVCGHLSTVNQIDQEIYYSNVYDTVRDDADDLMGVDSDGRPVYRIQRQSEALMQIGPLPDQGNLLDVGCGHGTFMRRFSEQMPGWNTWGYEVSHRYARNNISIGTFPDGKFDLVTSWYVLEHVEDPASLVSKMRDRITERGTIVIAVPDVLANPIDVLSVDHLSHFTSRSLAGMIRRTGLHVNEMRSDAIPGTLLAVASAQADTMPTMSVDDDATATTELTKYWRNAELELRTFCGAQQPQRRSIAIYGAGVYGAWMLARCGLANDRFACFVDMNRRKQGSVFEGIPIVGPKDLPESIECVLIGLRPESAEGAVQMKELEGLECFRLPDWNPHLESRKNQVATCTK
ncbi:MAG TPA: methyltransferase domain-containing protein [Phycisphaerales bacterium]|nr:methyltransferase domain-containing protein [Phycisphaerales bacterium]